MSEVRTLSIGDIFKDLMTLVEAHEIMTSDARMEGLIRAREIQKRAIDRVATTTLLRETRSIGEVFPRARVV